MKIGIFGKAQVGKSYTANLVEKFLKDGSIINPSESKVVLHKQFSTVLKLIAKGVGFDISEEAKEVRVSIYDFEDKLYHAMRDNLSMVYSVSDEVLSIMYAHAVEIFQEEYQSVSHLYLSPREFYITFGTDVVREKLGEDFWVNLMKKQLTNCNKTVIFSDVRFSNEAAMCDILVRVKGTSPIIFNNHPSEKQGDLISSIYADKLVVVHNNRLDDGVYEKTLVEGINAIIRNFTATEGTKLPTS